MSYSLKYSKNSLKEISKLDNLLKEKLKEAIDIKLLTNPFTYSTKLQNFKVEGVRRLRVGSYRIIFVIEDKTIEILKVGHRREIYK